MTTVPWYLCMYEYFICSCQPKVVAGGIMWGIIIGMVQPVGCRRAEAQFL